MTMVEGVLEYNAWWTMQDRVDEEFCRTVHIHGVDVLDTIRAWLRARDNTPLHMAYDADTITFAATLDHPHATNPDWLYAAGDAAGVTFGILQAPASGWGFSNVDYHIEWFLLTQNRSRVRLTITPDRLHLESLPDTVQQLKFTHSNACTLDSAIVNAVCKAGQGAECCAFLSAGVEGFQCLKFSSAARSLLDRVSNRTIHARRIGSCRVRGRDDGGINRMERAHG